MRPYSASLRTCRTNTDAGFSVGPTDTPSSAKALSAPSNGCSFRGRPRRRSRTGICSPADVDGQDPNATTFETVSVHPKKARWLCSPSGAAANTGNIVCYKAKSKRRLEAGPIYVDNEYGRQAYRFLGQRKEICVPAVLGPGGSTTTTSSSSTSSSTSTSTTAPPVCGGSGQPCCTGSTCGALLGCDYFTNTCMTCGEVEQPCCDDGVCNGNLVCMPDINGCSVP